ncbi:MAG: diguanylate cyclase response regulator [Epsilonproteobacteria bacterium]|nr:MAG: diguanylate cyclase response regulator [Campylobacterota bacterium]
MNQNIKILYVEDEPKIRENTKRPLSYLCDELIVANDGVEGLELYKLHSPDIVVSDIKMPNMNGIDMVKAIKDIDKNQHIIFTTAHSESGFFMEAIELHVDGYILKPIDYDLLENKIENIIEQINLKERLKEQEILTNEITKLQDNILVVLDDKHNIIFSNEKFLQFFNVLNTDEFSKKYDDLYSVFLQNDYFCIPDGQDKKDWIEQIQKLDETKRVVSILDITLFIPKSFLLSIKYMNNTSHTIITFTEITSITIEKNNFKHKAFTDELTGIYNRAYFNEEFKKEIAKFQRYKTPLSFIILDIDFFKKFNDTYGHQLGDDILVGLSNLIEQDTRATDTFARWGGEEFVKILPDTSLEDAKKVADALREKIQNHIFKDNLKVTCSFGVSQFIDDDTQESIMKKADDALYKAKENGRNKVEIG